MAKIREFKTPLWGMNDEEKAAFHAEALRILRANDEEPVGYRVLTEQPDEFCDQGCLAPGSSPHKHGVLVGYQLIAKGAIVQVDADMLPLKISSVHPFED